MINATRIQIVSALRRLALLLVLTPLASLGACAGDGGQTGDNGACTAGTQNCACRADDSCDSLGDTPMACVSNICTPEGTPDPGTLGGFCDDALPCGMHEGSPLDCVDNACTLPGDPPVGINVTVIDDTIRACDVLVQEVGGRLSTIVYDDDVMGEHLRERGRIGISFTAQRDLPITGIAARIELISDGSEDASVQSLSVECFDSLGQTIGGDGVTVE